MWTNSLNPLLEFENPMIRSPTKFRLKCVFENWKTTKGLVALRVQNCGTNSSIWVGVGVQVETKIRILFWKNQIVEQNFILNSKFNDSEIFLDRYWNIFSFPIHSKSRSRNFWNYLNLFRLYIYDYLQIYSNI